MRLDKYLAHCGLGTRKEVRQIIKSKCVYVDGKMITDSGLNIDENKSVIEVEGQRYNYEEKIYIMMNKQAGVVSAREDNYETTIFDNIDSFYFDRGLFPVGRLDKDTTGLLLLTNDGNLSHRLLSPKKHVDKVYHVILATSLTKENIEMLESGVALEDGYVCLPAIVDILGDVEINLTIREGKFHQVKRMMLACNNEVLKLKRIKMGSLVLDETLSEGEIRPLTEEEKEALLML